MVVSAGKKADLQRVGMLSSLRKISMYIFIPDNLGNFLIPNGDLIYCFLSYPLDLYHPLGIYKSLTVIGVEHYRSINGTKVW